MQTTGFIIDSTGEKILLLMRRGRKIDKWCFETHFKLRKSGKDGIHFTDEEDYLNHYNQEAFNNLIKGETITI